MKSWITTRNNALLFSEHGSTCSTFFIVPVLPAELNVALLCEASKPFAGHNGHGSVLMILLGAVLSYTNFLTKFFFFFKKAGH